MELSIIIFLLGFGIFLILLETLIPGGIAGTFGGLSLLAGLVGIFMEKGFYVGSAAVLLTAVCGVLLVGLWFRYIPKTKMGKGLQIQEDSKDCISYDLKNQALVGKMGHSITILRPVGRAVIDGEKYDVITMGDRILSNESIRVLKVEGNRIVVEKVEEVSSIQ
ncbi:MAG: NfeD family protein [Lentisphaeria bacterium]